jgi:hypothetical protein
MRVDESLTQVASTQLVWYERLIEYVILSLPCSLETWYVGHPRQRICNPAGLA